MSLPTFAKGIYPFYDAADLNPNTLTINTNISSSFADPYGVIDGVGVIIYGSDLWQNQSDGQSQAVTWVGNLLNQVDAHFASVGKPTKPVWIRLVPAVPPAWLIAGLTQPTHPTHERDAQLGIDWVSIHTATLGHSQAHMPYSHTAAYQSYVRNLRTWLAAGLAAADPNATRVPVLHWIGPFSQSKQMGIPAGVQSQQAWLADGSPDPVWQTGSFASDPIGNAWTSTKHVSAMETFAGEMNSISAFAGRYWFFTFTSNLIATSDQAPVLAAVAAAHPDGPNGVIPKQENFSVGVISTSTGLFTNVQRQVYRANIGGTGPPASDWYVAQQNPHSWEAFSPLTLKNNAGLGAQYQGVLTPNLNGTPGTAFNFSEWQQNMFYLTFSADFQGQCSTPTHPWSFEPFGSDVQVTTLNTYPSWKAALVEARGRIQGTLKVAKVSGTGTSRFLRFFKGVLP